VILLGLVVGVVLSNEGSVQRRGAAFEEEMAQGNQALAKGAILQAADRFEASRELPGADISLASLKLAEACYLLGEGYYTEWAALSGGTALSVVYNIERAELLANAEVKPVDKANYDAAMRNFDRAIVEAQKVERFPHEKRLWWKAQYLLGNVYLRTLVMVNNSPGDPRGTKVKRLFRECVQSYKNSLAGRPLPMSEADRVWDTYIKQNLELALGLERAFLASVVAEESQIENMSGPEETGEEHQQSPLKLLSPGEKDTLEKGGRVGVGELGGEK